MQSRRYLRWQASKSAYFILRKLIGRKYKNWAWHQYTESVYVAARSFLKSFVSLALIPECGINLGFDKLCTILDTNSPFVPYAENFEDTWVGKASRYGRRSNPLFAVSIWNQYENALAGFQKTKNSVERWHRAFQLGMGCAHPTFNNVLAIIIREQSSTENKVAKLKCGEKLAKCVKFEKVQKRIQEVLRNYQNSRLLKELEGLAFNFDF